MERFAATLSDALIMVSNLNKQEAIQLNLAPSEKFVTIYRGIDFNRFTANSDRDEKCKALGLDPHRPVVGTVGRLSPQKAP